MQKKRLQIIVLFLVCLSLLGCSSANYLRTKYIGKCFNKSCFNSIKDSGHHFSKTKFYDIEYDYSIDNKKKTIELDCKMIYNKTADESFYHSETILLNVENFEMRVFFADTCGKIVGVEVLYLPSGKNIFDPLEFKAVLPYSDNYALINLSYIVHYKGT